MSTKKQPRRFQVGDEVMFTKSMAPCTVDELQGNKPHPVYGWMYGVVKHDGGKQMSATEAGLQPLADFPAEQEQD
jgi:hypothetical protein